MATIASRLTNTGTLLVNGSIDEVTFNATTPAIKNLFRYTEDLSNVLWTKIASTVTTDQVLSPSGTLTADKLIGNNGVTTRKSTYQAYASYVAGTTYTYSVYLQQAGFTNAMIWFDTANCTSGAYFGAGSLINLAAGTVGGSQTKISSVGNGWYRCVITFIPSISGNYNIQISLGDANGNGTATGDGVSGIYIWGAQLEISSSATTYQGIAAANTLVTTTFATKTTQDTIYSTGLYDEVTYNSVSPTIKNLFIYTEQMDQWIKTSVTVNSDALLAPNNTLTADLVVEGAVSTNKELQKSVTVVSGVTYTISLYAKTAGRERFRFGLNTAFFSSGTNAFFDLVNGATSTLQGGFTSSTIQSVGNGWYRCTATFTPIASGSMISYITLSNASNLTTYAGDGTSGIYVWGTQVEVGNAATIYQGIGASTLITPNFAKRETTTGDMYVTTIFDEFTGAPVVDTNLIKWLDGGQTLSLTSASATWLDLSGYASYATLTSGTTYASGNGGSIAFNGTTAMNMATVANYPATFADPWTAEVWIYIPSSVTWGTTYKTGIFQKGTYAGFHGLTTTITNNQVAVALRGTTGGSSASVGTIGRDAWYNVVGTWSGNTSGGALKLYINGVLAQATTPTIVEAPSGTIWVIGSNAVEGAPGNYFNGNISAVKLYTRELTADEVAQNFNALRRRYNL